MKNSKKSYFSLICVVLGIAIVIGAAGFLLHRRIDQSSTAQKANSILPKVLERMPQIVDRVPEERGENRMPSLQIDGINVILVLEFSRYARQLPVLSGWDADLASVVPCRFTGSIYDSSIIIGAGDRQGQLDFANQLEVGEKLTLTDMEGGRYSYQVMAIQHAQHATLEKLQEGEYDLTLFVKDSKSGAYLLIRCNTAM